ncbi:hypothetical protein ILYODFUR_013990 [Ilyodon furcidens]|uniref:Receptor activity-modifying protein 1 n=1 Tax=Ilyodon furcidens TaxID=33524 RepID=A0ABV0SWV2_9TELE
MKFVSSMALLLKAGLLLLLAARVCPSVTGCDRRLYETVINDFCLEQFQLDMGRLNSGLWCTWPETMEIYEGLTNCTYQLALRMDCFWPNRVVDGFFMQIHRSSGVEEQTHTRDALLNLIKGLGDGLLTSIRFIGQVRCC